MNSSILTVAPTKSNFNPQNVVKVGRNLKLLNRTLYRFQISITGASRSTSIKWEDLELDEASLSYLKQSKVKLSNFSIFSKLDEYASELAKKRRAIEDKTIFVENNRVVTEKNLEAVLIDYQELLELAASFRANLQLEYDEGLAEFTERVTKLLSTPKFGLTPEQIEAKVALIKTKFISKEEIDSLLIVKVEFYEIPALSEQIQEQTKLAEKYAELQTAKNQEAAAAAMAQIQEQQRRELEATRQGMYGIVRQEISKMIATQIEAIANFEVGKANKCIKNKLDKHLARLETLVDMDFDGSFANANAKLQELRTAMESEADETSLEAQLIKLRQELRTSLETVSVAEIPTLDVAELEF